MDYEKAYEDAIERAKCIYNENPSSSTAKFVCGQIFPEIKESEDERVRKALLKLVSNDKNNGYTDFYKAEGITCDDAIAYIAKQKEQTSTEGDNETEIQKAFREGKSAGRKEVFDHPEEYGLQKEQEPAEWSEEEKGILLECISALQNSSHWLLADKLSSLRPHPHWKPSEEQMRVFWKANPVNLMPEELSIYHSLCNDLKKL